MRSDIVPGKSSPITNCPTIRLRHAQSSASCRGRSIDPHSRPRALLSQGTPTASGTSRVLPRKSPSLIRKSLRSPPATHHTIQSSAREPSGPSSPTLSGRFRKISTSPSTPTRSTTDIPHTFVLRPGLVIHSIYNGYCLGGRPSLRPLARPARCVEPDSSRLGPGPRRDSEEPG